MREVPSSRSYVVSAGYGLLAVDDPISSYGATLSPGHPDSVQSRSARISKANAAWMAGLRAWSPPQGTMGAGSIAEVASSNPSDPIIVCLGRTYVEAVADDLVAAAEVLEHRELLTVFSTGGALTGLDESWVDVPGRLRMTLGGTLGSTATRTARAVVAATGTEPFTSSAARRLTEVLVSDAPPLPPTRGLRASDDVVRLWIEDHVRNHPASSVSSALKALRNAGLACEQSRFRSLFEGVTS